MKLGVISDVHAQLAALEQALTLLDSFGVEQIVCAGDLAEKGPDGDAVVRLVRERGIPCVQGNHDRDAVGNQDWLREYAVPGHPHLLRDETLAFLAGLPTTRHTTITGKNITLAHGTPWSPDVYLFKSSPRSVYERIAEETQADVVIVGHTHSPMQVTIGPTMVVNPGAVTPHGSHTCGLLTLPDLRWQVLNIQHGAAVAFPWIEFPG